MTALALAAAIFVAQVVPAVPNAPLPVNGTQQLIFQAQMAIAESVRGNPQAAIAATIPYRQAMMRFENGDDLGARSFALQAIREAQAGMQPAVIPTLAPFAPRTPQMPLIAGASIARIDAGAFLAQARFALDGCTAATAPAHFAAAQRAYTLGANQKASGEARTVVDLCASAHR